MSKELEDRREGILLLLAAESEPRDHVDVLHALQLDILRGPEIINHNIKTSLARMAHDVAADPAVRQKADETYAIILMARPDLIETVNHPKECRLSQAFRSSRFQNPIVHAWGAACQMLKVAAVSAVGVASSLAIIGKPIMPLSPLPARPADGTSVFPQRSPQ